MLMNLETLDWDDDLPNFDRRASLDAARDPPSSQVYGEAVGAAAGVAVAGDLGDQQAALFGQTCRCSERPRTRTAPGRSCC